MMEIPLSPKTINTKDMTREQLSVTLRELALSQPTPLCEQWTEAWRDDTSVDELLDKFVRGQDFCIENDYPPLDFCRSHFNKKDLRCHHIFLDDNADITISESGCYIFIGNTNARVLVDGLVSVRIYVRHSCHVDIDAINGAFVVASYHDYSSGSANSDVWAKIKKINHQKNK